MNADLPIVLGAYFKFVIGKTCREGGAGAGECIPHLSPMERRFFVYRGILEEGCGLSEGSGEEAIGL